MNEKELTRRDFFGLIGHTSIGSSIAGSAVITYKYLNPNVLFEPPSIFKVGNADDFAEDSIKFIEARKLFIINREGGFQAISAVCTHLGCTVKMAPKNHRWRYTIRAFVRSYGDISTLTTSPTNTRILRILIFPHK